MLEFGEDLGEFVFGACEARAAVAQEFGGAACAFGKCVDIAVLGSELCEFSSSASAWAYVVSVLAIFYSIDCVMVDMMSGPEAKVVVIVSPGLREELSVTARPAARVME